MGGLPGAGLVEGGGRMERVLEASHLTTADVARRLGVQGGTVRHYGEILRARGYPFTQGENGEWLWAPEVAEVARGAYLLAKATPGLSFERALDLLEYAGRVALSTKPGTTLPEVLSRLDRLPERLSRVAPQVEEGARELLQKLRGDAALTLVKASEDMAKAGGNLLQAMRAQVERMKEATAEVRDTVAILVFLPSLVLLIENAFLALAVQGIISLPRWFPFVGVVLVGLTGYLLGRWRR